MLALPMEKDPTTANKARSLREGAGSGGKWG
jgi:hypothetical protein